MTGEAVRWVLAPNPSLMTLDGTRTYIVGQAQPVVIDPGPASDVHTRRVLAALDGAKPVAIVLTHAHKDHAGGASDLARATGSPVWMGAGSLVGPEPPVLDRLARDGDVLETDAGSLVVVATPGHAPEHVCLHWLASGELGRGGVFVGDLLMGQGDTTLVAHPEGDVARYLESLNRIEALGGWPLYPAHGNPISDVSATITRYRRHRIERISGRHASPGVRSGVTPARRTCLVPTSTGDDHGHR
jgi:glyoxylase-like metal-dependent hydrolase (beta-lactamase superfamily II)